MREAADLAARLAAAGFALDLLDLLPDVVFFVKDAAGRYVAVNETLVARLGLTSKVGVLGKTARELFPPPLGQRYLDQDLAVARGGRPFTDLLELHLYPGGREGWCLTTKLPVRGEGGALIGVAGTSRDVSPAPAASLPGLAEALRLVHERYDEPLRVGRLAAVAGMTAARFTRSVRALFGLTPAQLVIKARVDAARRMLREGAAPVAQVGQACGYCDQSAFTRQFKVVVGLPPARYREHRRGARARP